MSVLQAVPIAPGGGGGAAVAPPAVPEETVPEAGAGGAHPITILSTIVLQYLFPLPFFFLNFTSFEFAFSSLLPFFCSCPAAEWVW